MYVLYIYYRRLRSAEPGWNSHTAENAAAAAAAAALERSSLNATSRKRNQYMLLRKGRDLSGEEIEHLSIVEIKEVIN